MVLRCSLSRNAANPVHEKRIPLVRLSIAIFDPLSFSDSTSAGDFVRDLSRKVSHGANFVHAESGSTEVGLHMRLINTRQIGREIFCRHC